jgi:3'(2'), 5'-bisphosphate nucleotidase
MTETTFDASRTRAISRRMRDLALLAGEETMKYFRTDALDVRGKADGSPVSAADLAANAVIMEGLRASFPEIPVVSEEVGSDVPTDWAAPFFLLDPLDGTKEFIRGSGDFTVNIALVVGHKPVLGAVFAPVSQRLQWVRGPGDAVEETPPFAADALGDLRSLACRTADNGAITAALSRSHMNEATRAYIARYAVAHAIHAGSSLKFCLLAAGEADLYPRLSPTMEWDTAAADAVLAAAGGSTVDFITGEPLRYGKPGLSNPFFIAHGPGVRLIPSPS